MFDRVIKIRNGDRLVDFVIYKCDNCNSEIKESDYAYFNKNIELCRECAFINGYFSSKQFLESIGINSPKIHAAINLNNEIEVWYGKDTPPWERTKKQQRHSLKYSNWRTKVFERDNYTCQRCGIRGGELNAHHIKSFAKYKKLRYAITNGMTLCRTCHIKEHSKKEELA